MLSCDKVQKFKMSKVENEVSHLEQESFLQSSNNKANDESAFDEDTRCGFGFLRGRWMQKLASKKTFLVIHALIGMFCHASWYYFSGILTTLEKHYKLSSTQIAFFGSVNDIVATAVSLIVPYYCSKGRFPRWMGFAAFCIGVSQIIFILPVVFYGAGEDALSLTEEYGASFNPNATQELIHQMKMKELCYENSEFGLISMEICQYL